MCIVQTLKKFRNQNCAASSNNNNTTGHNVTHSFNASKLCPGEDEALFPWYTPELDIYNQNHMLYYSSENALEEINASEHNFPNKLWLVAAPSEIIVKTSLFIPLVIWGIFGNVALLYVIMKYRHLRTPTNMIIANMATVDLVSLVIYPWIFLVCDLFQNYQLGEFGCLVDGWLEFSLLLINVINMCTISYDRLTAIVIPQETRLTRDGAKIVIVVSWIISLILASPLMIYRQYKKRQWLDFVEIYCTENTVVISIYWHILLVLAVWIPAGVMLICYLAIFIKLDRYEQKVLKREHPLSVCYKTKVAKVTFIVVLTFILCRLPLTVLIFRRNQWLKMNIQDQVLDIDHILWFVARYVLYLDAALDPLIYGLTNENFRRAFRSTAVTRVFFARKKKKPPVMEKLCVHVIQPRGPYKTDQKSDAWLIRKSRNSCDNNNKSDDSSQTVTKNVVFHS